MRRVPVVPVIQLLCSAINLVFILEHFWLLIESPQQLAAITGVRLKTEMDSKGFL